MFTNNQLCNFKKKKIFKFTEKYWINKLLLIKKNDLTPLQDLSILFNFTSLSHFSAKSKLNVTQPRHPAKNKETIQRKKKNTH